MPLHTQPHPPPPARKLSRGLQFAALAAAVLSSVGMAGFPGVGGPVVPALHVLSAAALFLVGGSRREYRAAYWTCAFLTLLLGAVAWLPGAGSGTRRLALYAHLAAGAGVFLLLLRPWRLRRAGSNRLLAGVGTVLVLALLTGYTAAETTYRNWFPPAYDADTCYRFLTATTAEQAGNPSFPSALKISPRQKEDCTRSGCHAEIRHAWSGHAHATAAAGPGYQRTYADFIRRKGAAAGAWCQGCHAPGTLLPEEEQGVGCQDCHGATGVYALFGGGALELGSPTKSAAGSRWEPRLRPTAHARKNLRPAFHRSAEFCAGCHRKNYNLPQNQFQWMPGPDPYRDWTSSPHSGAVLLTGERVAQPRSCTGCHAPHDTHAPEAKPAPVQLDLFLRDGRNAAPAESAAPAPGKVVFLDVVLHNSGIGHSFPTGMPDLQEAWVEIDVRDRNGRPLARSGTETQFYRLLARDRKGRLLTHGELDEMASVQEWRRIPPGEADLARYRLRVPAAGLGALRARLLRRPRPDFARWAGVSFPAAPEVVAETQLPLIPSSPHPLTRPNRWRRYGMALTAVRSYPEALQALKQAQSLAPNDAETRLCMGRMYWEEGDLLAAREQFQQAKPGGGDTAIAWEARVLRKMGQPEQSLTLLRALAQKYPRDPNLRFELGRTQMDLLANEAAADEFRALLGIDPLNVAGHYNLMLCLQRMNQLSEASREETLYRLLSGGDAAPGETSRGTAGDRPLRVYPLETP